jgi:hypothetical protein
MKFTYTADTSAISLRRYAALCVARFLRLNERENERDIVFSVMRNPYGLAILGAAGLPSSVSIGGRHSYAAHSDG